ncbi:phosphatase PAP2 family protein [Rhodococcus kroppenstedtii]|uniref:phosphatase PAP2 family protein n=1 Tax=Rhodococcoides kroppenstedtii TaxID=293050 RepID=UPI00295336D3|nr:phosphatase PAP2 family protein [Rhodococcus kroppenstedtii]MDV7196996.1 phosphatase PAP2 family protein [Rhodococcus kroppenstedtii]
MIDGTNELDTAVLTWMVDHRTPWVTDVMTVVTTVGNTVGVAVLTVILAAIVWRRGDRRAALATLAVMLLGWGLMNGIKYAVRRTRPPTPERLVDLSTWSFPSGHAMMSAMVAAVAIVLIGRGLLGRARKRGRAAAAVLTAATLLIGFSRLYLGAHWCTDVLAGWVLGALWGTLALRASLSGAATSSVSDAVR